MTSPRPRLFGESRQPGRVSARPHRSAPLPIAGAEVAITRGGGCPAPEETHRTSPTTRLDVHRTDAVRAYPPGIHARRAGELRRHQPARRGDGAGILRPMSSTVNLTGSLRCGRGAAMPDAEQAARVALSSNIASMYARFGSRGKTRPYGAVEGGGRAAEPNRWPSPGRPTASRVNANRAGLVVTEQSPARAGTRTLQAARRTRTPRRSLGPARRHRGCGACFLASARRPS